MKNSKAIMLAIFASTFVVLTVVNMSLASTKTLGENTLDMLEIMTRAYDEGGEGGTGCCFCPETTYLLCSGIGDQQCVVFYYISPGGFIGQHTLDQSTPGVHHMVCAGEIIITPGS
jgi:hypothetical protein